MPPNVFIYRSKHNTLLPANTSDEPPQAAWRNQNNFPSMKTRISPLHSPHSTGSSQSVSRCTSRQTLEGCVQHLHSSWPIHTQTPSRTKKITTVLGLPYSIGVCTAIWQISATMRLCKHHRSFASNTRSVEWYVCSQCLSSVHGARNKLPQTCKVGAARKIYVRCCPRPCKGFISPDSQMFSAECEVCVCASSMFTYIDTIVLYVRAKG